MPGRNGHDEPGQIDMAEKMGSPARTTPWTQVRDGCLGSPYCGDTPSDLGRWHSIPAGYPAEHGLIECSSTLCLLDRRPLRSRRDVVPMMPWSGLSLTHVKHANEMGTSELHRTSIMLAASALTTDRSMYPKDLSQKPPQKAGRARIEPVKPLRRINLPVKRSLTGTASLPKS